MGRCTPGQSRSQQQEEQQEQEQEQEQQKPAVERSWRCKRYVMTLHNKGIANVTVLTCHESNHNLAFPSCCCCVCVLLRVLHVILGRCASIREGLPEIELEY